MSAKIPQLKDILQKGNFPKFALDCFAALDRESYIRALENQYRESNPEIFYPGFLEACHEEKLSVEDKIEKAKTLLGHKESLVKHDKKQLEHLRTNPDNFNPSFKLRPKSYWSNPDEPLPSRSDLAKEGIKSVRQGISCHKQEIVRLEGIKKEWAAIIKTIELRRQEWEKEKEKPATAPPSQGEKEKIPHKQIALYYRYKVYPITANNCNGIAKKYGWESPTSGRKLFDVFKMMDTKNQRTAKGKYVVRDIEQVIKMLCDDPDAQVFAKDELKAARVNNPEY